MGDLAQVAGKRWRLDIGARQEVSLQLSSVDLPGGAQVSTWLGKASPFFQTTLTWPDSWRTPVFASELVLADHTQVSVNAEECELCARWHVCMQNHRGGVLPCRGDAQQRMRST